MQEAEAFLDGKSQAVKADLARQMEEAAEALDFERAARYRDRIQAMSFVTQTQGINPQGGRGGGCLRPRAGGRADLHPGVLLPLVPELGQPRLLPQGRHEPWSAPEILAAFLAQFYDDKPVPGLVLLSHEIEERALLEEALSTHAGRRIEVAVPQRGEKKTLVEHAVTNAREALGRQDGRNPRRRRSCWKACSASSAWPKRRGASRSMTTPTSRAPTRWAP